MKAALLLLACAMLVACSPREPSARASLDGSSGSSAQGELLLTAVDGGVLIVGEMSGLRPDAELGFHVHEHGDCSATDASSAGAHLNPGQSAHGGPATPVRHLGDLPNLASDSSGKATVETTLTGATLRDGGPNDLVARAFVIHERRDDHVSQPAGDAGARIACGVVR
jgi:Cu-Zn family superoxide dismutase